MFLATAPEQERPGARLELLLAVACAGATFLVFLPVLRNGFVLTWDDGDFVVRNAFIRDFGRELVREAFSGAKAHYFAPLTWLSYALDFRLWGLDPFGFHLTSLILHASSAGLAFLLAHELLATAPVELEGTARRWAALAAALAWSLHPLRVESVAWIAERKGVLGVFFGLAAILAYLRHVRSGASFWRSGWYAWTLALLCLSLLSKPLLVTLPAVLAVLDAYPLRRFGPRRSLPVLAEKLPLLGIAAALGAHFALTANAGPTFSLAESGYVSRLLVALRSVWDYLRLTAWPSGVSPFYLHPGDVRLGDLHHLLPSAAVLAVTAAAIVKARKHPAIAAAWISWLLALAPGLMSTQVSVTSMADRFTYFAALPLTLLAVAAAAKWLARRSPRAAAAGAAGIAAGLALLAGLSVRQVSVWRDDVALWTRPIDLNPRLSGRVYTERALAREQRADWSGARADMDSAIAIATSKRYPYMSDLFSRRARILVSLGLMHEAIADYGRALQSEGPPGPVETLLARAAAYRAAGLGALADADERLAAEMAGGR